MQCPNCQNEVTVKDKDIGALFTCPKCRSVYFINFDGTPDYSQVQQPSTEELAKLQSLPEKKSKKKPDAKAEEPEQSEPTAEPVAEEPLVEPPVEPMAFEPIPEAPLPIEALPTEAPSIENFSYESTSAEQSFSSKVTSVIPQNFEQMVSEIEAFGNQQTTVAGLAYDLEIVGLDSKESQSLLKEAINDLRFGWHVEDIIREMKTGTCRFKDLTPVQAFVLARRIQFIDVEMKWTQNVIA